MTVLFDLERDVVDEVPPAWTAAPTPGSVDLLTAGVQGLVRSVVDLSARGLSMAVHPRDAVRSTAGAVTALAEAAKPLVDAAPKTPLNIKPGPHRLVAIVDTQLADYKLVKAHSGGATVNVPNSTPGARG